MINYAVVDSSARNYTIDKSKRNILLIGKAETNNKNKIIMNPVSTGTAKQLYGDSTLYRAYKEAREITNDTNIYTVNCQMYTDFIELIDSLIHYNFDFIVPLDIYLRDTFVNPVTNKSESFFGYYLERLGITENRTTLIMTDYASYKYENIDMYLSNMAKMYDDVYASNLETLNKYGNNLIFVLNNLNQQTHHKIKISVNLK